MELLLPLGLFCTVSRTSLSHLNPCFNGDFSRGRRFLRKPNRISVSLRSAVRSERDSSSNGHGSSESEVGFENFSDGNSKFIDVVGIGSRKDAILDFCLDSPFQTSKSLRIWNILLKDSARVQLQQRSLVQGGVPTTLESQTSLLSSSQAIVLVATAGYDLDKIPAIELLKDVKSADKLAIGIILKPFSFEGQRRQDEVSDLINKLQEETSFCIVVDTDALLKRESLTLAEALRSANNAVFLAMNAMSILMSDMHKKIIDQPQCEMKELKIPEVVELLECYKEAKVGFGAGNNMKSSIAKAIYDCPFLSGDVKDIGMVVCTITSCSVMGENDLRTFLRSFRRTTGFMKGIVVSIVHEPNLELNVVVTTVITMSCIVHNVSHKKGFLSNLAMHFPFVFSLLGTNSPDREDTLPAQSHESTHQPEVVGSSDSGAESESLGVSSEELQTQSDSNLDKINALRELIDEEKKFKDEIFKSNEDLVSNVNNHNSEEEPAFQREALISRTIGPGFQIAKEWAKERALSGDSPLHDEQSSFTFPIGVKPFEQSADSQQFSNTSQPSKSPADINGVSLGSADLISWDVLTDAGVETVMDIYNAASTLIKGKHSNNPKKQGVLSVRAASMLEAERDSEKKWSRITEMEYRGGTYRGRCQGGLPEGKGCLTLTDGSIYDGMWRYGKRSGPGTFYFSNGDVFQGSWRDDLMHGRGWFYFHTGDRWFSNFWKGKAEGEGRFYSKGGEIFFGNFRDGWRHGHSLFIDADGKRWAEIWDEGVLLSREHLDSETNADK